MAPVPTIRPATRADADLLTEVEAEGDRQFEALFGPLDWRPTRGTWRLAAPGFVLVAAARARAAERGYDVLSLCTYADVPWNAPFYRLLGFEELTDLSPVHRAMQEKEERLGLMAHGRRVVMRAPTRT